MLLPVGFKSCMLRYLNNTHADAQYEAQLKALIDRLHAMVKYNTDLARMARQGLTELTDGKAQAKRIDKEINALEADIENAVQTLLTRYSPQLVELRFILASLKIAASLERMGDHAKNTVKRLQRVEGKLNGMNDIMSRMLERMEGLLTQLETLLLHFKPEDAGAITASDDVMDELYKQSVVAISKHMHDGSLPNEAISHALFIAKNIERMADHVTDITRELYYVHTGERMKKTAE